MPQRFSKPYLNNFNLSTTAITFFSTFNSNLRKKVSKLISVNFLLQCHSSLYYYYYVLPTKFNTSLICYVHHGTFLHGNFFPEYTPHTPFLLYSSSKKSSNHNLSQKAISFSYSKGPTHMYMHTVESSHRKKSLIIHIFMSSTLR